MKKEQKIIELRRAAKLKVSELETKIKQVKAECEKQCSSAEDDQEPENEQPQQQTVYCDGSEYSARIVAQRLINKMPHIPKDGFLFVHIIRKKDGDFFVGVTESGESVDKHIDINFTKNTHTANVEAAFVERARRMFAEEQESGNSHVAEPLSRALDAVFGGNPVDQVDNLISDTIKDGKEGGNE